MSRIKDYLDIDVVTAARDRIRHIYDTHDTVAVCFSGGKDSLAALHLTWEIAQERSLGYVNVIFRDEELIPDEVIAFVDEYRQMPWVRMLYFAVPLRSTRFILGRVLDYIQWDPSREHLRPVPEHAITLPKGDTRVFDQYTMDAFAARYFKGKIAFVNGIRAAESLIRYRASVNKLGVDSYVNSSSATNVSLCKPLYDWEENDVFKYFHDSGIRYCPIYDMQNLSGTSLRVATPFIAESAKKLSSLRATVPEFYRGIMRLFPEMTVQERYYHELDRKALTRRYGQSFEGVRAYIMENIQEERQQRKAEERLDAIMRFAARRPSGYPPAYVLNYFITGAFKRSLMPLGARHARSKTTR